ncbi:MAG: winged helix-turn-helix domain-containing protein [Candidatus Aenigmatarchaeota archaeon]
MDIDKRTIKVLSSDTRVDILKSLIERRKMPSELSKEMGMAASTIVEHLRQLESAGLVEKRRTGRKWIYYELTRQGRSLVKPQFPVQFNVLLTLGVIFMFAGITFFMSFALPAQLGAMRETSGYEGVAQAPMISEKAAPSYQFLIDAVLQWLWLIIFLIGFAMLAIALIIRYDLPVRR